MLRHLTQQRVSLALQILRLSRPPTMEQLDVNVDLLVT